MSGPTEGTVVVIDVYRAYTTAAVAFEQGAEKIILVAEVDEALELRRRGLGDLCMGEVHGHRPEGFDLGNSPHEISCLDLTGKTLIQSTRAGTTGAVAATKASRLFAGSLVVARATVRALLSDQPLLVSLVAMGSWGRERTDEDEQCALYLWRLAIKSVAIRDKGFRRTRVGRAVGGVEVYRAPPQRRPPFNFFRREIRKNELSLCFFKKIYAKPEGLGGLGMGPGGGAAGSSRVPLNPQPFACKWNVL